MPLFTYDKCEGGGHGDGEYYEEDGGGSPGAARGQQLILTTTTTLTRQRLQLASAPASETNNLNDMFYSKAVLRSRSRWSRNYFGTWSRSRK